MKRKAIHNYALVQTLEIKSDRLDKETLKQPWARIESIGPGTYNPNGTLIKPPFEVGDIVFCARHGINQIDSYEKQLGNPNTLALVVEFDIMAIYKEELPHKIKPAFNYILIQPDSGEVTTATGLKLPSRRQSMVNSGTILELGTGWRNQNGDIIPWQVKIGDRVEYDPTKTIRISMETLGEKVTYTMISHADIMAVFE